MAMQHSILKPDFSNKKKKKLGKGKSKLRNRPCRMQNVEKNLPNLETPKFAKLNRIKNQ